MTFSNRTPDNLSPNSLSLALETIKEPVIDLTQSNPTLCGFNYPLDLLKNLGRVESLTYDPQAFGLLKAREILAGYLSSLGHKVKAENLILTASTSEAYGYLFKLLGNPGESFLVPMPGYPLLDHLLGLEGLELIPYPFKTQPDWPVDLGKMEKAITPRTKGLISVNPHNPTGAFLSEKDQTAVLNLCEKHSLTYLSDEVFADYGYGAKPKWISNPKVLTFRMGGLSKSLGLPQLKLSWIEISGPEHLVSEAKDRLELIADTYLSVNAPVQVALEGLLAFAPDIQGQIKTRISNNKKSLEKALVELPVKVWPVQGGWYALVEVLLESANDDLVIELLREQKVLVQPGGFYDFSSGSFWVISLLTEPNIFNEGVNRLKKFVKNLL